MSKISNIAKNTSYFTLALVIQKAITFVYFLILGRNLNPDDLGKFYLAISFSSIFLTLIDLGQANLLMREMAKDSDDSRGFVRSVVAIKLPLILVSSLVVVVLANLMNYPELTRHLIYYSISLMVLDSLSTTFFSIIRGRHNLKYESIIAIVNPAITLILGVYFVLAHYSLLWLMAAQIAGTLFRFVASSSFLMFKLKINIRPDFDYEKIKKILVLTVPFALYGIFNKLYMFLDTVLLSKLADDFQTGLYQIAFKFIFALQFLPLAFVASLYPAFSSYWKDRKEGQGKTDNTPSQLTITFERAMSYLSLISLPIALGIFAIAPELIGVFKPEYRAGIWPLRVSIIALIFIFINYPIGSLLNACDRQKENTRNMGIVMAISIIMNLLIIPKYQALGASVTVLITNIMMLILGLWYVPKIIELRPGKLLTPFFKALFAALLMALVVEYLKMDINILLTVILGGIFYAIMIVLTGAIKRADIRSVVRSFGK